MKKSVKLIIYILLIIPTVTASSSNKTMLSYAPKNCLLKTFLYKSNHPELHKNILQYYGYTRSYNNNKLRTYFFPYEKPLILFGDRDSINNSNRTTTDLDYRFFINTDDAGSRNVTLYLKPEQHVHFFKTCYESKLGNNNKPFLLRVEIPFVRLTNHLNPSFISQGFDPAENHLELEQFFNGTLLSQEQTQLLYTKISNKKNTSSGLADITLQLEKDIIQNETTHVTGGAEVIFPTSNKPKGRFLFEPLRGHNGHWGFSIYGECNTEFWKHTDYTLEISTSTKLTYFIKNNQIRTLGLREYPWGQFILLGKNGNINQPLFPATNILTCKVKVQPGIESQSNIITTLRTPSINIGLGYSLLIKGNETIGLHHFCEETYGIAAFGYDTSDEFTLEATRNGHWLRKQDIDLNAAQTSSQMIHYVSCSITKIMEYEKVNILIHAGTQTTFSSENSAPLGYTIWTGCNLQV